MILSPRLHDALTVAVKVTFVVGTWFLVVHHGYASREGLHVFVCDGPYGHSWKNAAAVMVFITAFIVAFDSLSEKIILGVIITLVMGMCMVMLFGSQEFNARIANAWETRVFGWLVPPPPLAIEPPPLPSPTSWWRWARAWG